MIAQGGGHGDVPGEADKAVAFLATRVNCCTVDEVEKFQRPIRYIHGTEGNGVVLRPAALGVTIRLYVDASY